MKSLSNLPECILFLLYNQATSSLAINSHETSEDKLSEALNRQSIIVIQVHDKLHENLFISTCSLVWIKMKVVDNLFKKLM